LENEKRNFLNCIKTNTRPANATLEDAARAVQIVEAEMKSVQTGKPVRLAAPKLSQV
jgi:predicted dehydrogenase